jgi:hypothetical protein
MRAAIPIEVNFTVFAHRKKPFPLDIETLGAVVF